MLWLGQNETAVQLDARGERGGTDVTDRSRTLRRRAGKQVLTLSERYAIQIQFYDFLANYDVRAGRASCNASIGEDPGSWNMPTPL